GGALGASGVLTLRGSTIADNSAIACGGGVAADQLEISDTRVLGNLLRGGAQTIFDLQALQPQVDKPSGAGIFAKSVKGTRITVANNRIRLPSSVGRRGLLTVTNQGGGIRADSATLVNATVVGNAGSTGCSFANGDQIYYGPQGLGVYAGTLSLEHTTLTDPIVAAHLQTHRSLVTGGFNANPCPLAAGFVPVPQGSVDASSYNFYDGENLSPLGPGDRLVAGTPLLLGALAENGGAVPTAAPGAGSPLIDYIPTANCPTLEDARGVVRPQGPGCDVGAVEAAR
ncbi:MAG TPA: choice-of-anchor Q domain-containing protein, partial [Polyangiaceae bacterium]|nr:choice-of-anchor Q domain-containing protein [Polyangiaceae bacterium]